MLLTPEQEQKIIEENMPKIHRAVDNFTARCTAEIARVPRDDFVQEVTIAFLKYIRGCEKPEDMNRFPWLSANHAMRRLVMEFQPMSVPKDMHLFSEIIHTMPSTISINVIGPSSGLEIDGMAKCWVDDKDTQMDFDIFMADKPDYVKRVASMRIYGMKLREIAEQCGVSATSIWKKLLRLENAYKKYTEDAKNAE